MSGSTITSEIDFEATGKQEDFLHVLHSVQRSTFDWIPINVTFSISRELLADGASVSDKCDTARFAVVVGD